MEKGAASAASGGFSTGGYAATADPAPARLAHPDPDKAAAALRAFFRIADLWDLSADEARILLGQPPRSTFYKWKRGDPSAVPHDVVRRISYVLGIYKSLQILFKDAAQADGWVRRPGRDFAGASALDRMLGGDVADLADVRRYLDVARGQGS